MLHQILHHRLRATSLGLGLLLTQLAGCGGGSSSVPLAQAQTLQFGSAPTTLTLGSSATVTASASSGLPIGLSSLTPSICSVKGSGLVQALTPGTCIIAANQAGDADHVPATQITLNLNIAVAQVSQTLSFGTAPTLTLGGSATVVAQATSSQPVSYSSLTPTTCNVDSSSGLTLGLAQGNCTIAANQSGNSWYLPAAQVTQTLAVTTSGTATVPGAPSNVTASLGSNPQTVQIRIGATASGGSPITGYTVSSNPAGLSASGNASQIQVTCGGSCAGYTFTVTAANALGSGAVSDSVHVLTQYQIVTTWYEPQTQPNNSIFSGSFTLDSSTRSISTLSGTLTESMTDTPMTTVPLTHQLVLQADSSGTGLLVGSFYLPTTNTFVVAHSNGGWRPGLASDARYYGYPNSANPASGGVGNAYALVYINPENPTVALSSTQLNQMAYADCTALGMMGATCMTGTAASVYGTVGTMGGVPASQVITLTP